jgi:hypothetical protein
MPGLPPLGAKVTGRRGKRGGPSDAAASQQRWKALSRVVSDGGFSAGTADQQPPLAAMPPLPSAAHGPPLNAQLAPANAGLGLQQGVKEQTLQHADVTMSDANPPQAGCQVAEGGLQQQPRVSEGQPPRISPFAHAPLKDESSSSESDTESEEDAIVAGVEPFRNLAEGPQELPGGEKRPGSPSADPSSRPSKKQRSSLAFPATRAASLNTVLAAVEERTARQGSGAMDAAVGSAPTTVEDCLQNSSFGIVRKVRLLSSLPGITKNRIFQYCMAWHGRLGEGGAPGIVEHRLYQSCQDRTA